MSTATNTTPIQTTAGPVVPERYLQALGGRDPVEALRKAPKRVRKLLKDVSEKRLARRPAPDKWSVKEVVAHLADGEVVLGARIRFVAAMENPPLPGYDQDLFVQRLGIERVKTKALLEAFASMRALNVSLLERLPKEALARTGLHAERGPESIATMIGMYAGHDLLHEEQIARVLTVEADGAKARKKLAKAERAQAKAAARARKAEQSVAVEREPTARASKNEARPSRKGGKQKLETADAGG
jgi:hypothetical protein